MIKIDKEKCTGCATCTVICPSNFSMGDDDKAEVISQEKADCVEQAKEMCPAQAISVE